MSELFDIRREATGYRERWRIEDPVNRLVVLIPWSRAESEQEARTLAVPVLAAARFDGLEDMVYYFNGDVAER